MDSFNCLGQCSSIDVDGTYLDDTCCFGCQHTSKTHLICPNCSNVTPIRNHSCEYCNLEFSNCLSSEI